MARWARVVVPEFRGWVDKVQWTGQVPPPPQGPLPTVWDQLSYSYDPAGRRIEKKYDGMTVVKYLYDGEHCLAEYDGNNNLLRKFIYGPAVDEPIAMIDVEHSNATYYYHFDGLGSVTALTNASGTTAVLYEYSVYGQVAASDPNHPNRFMFTGREFDQETGLYYYRARYYNPEIGRFLQTDPVGYGAGMNLYRYCVNNPLTWLDPFGLRAAPPEPNCPPLEGYKSMDDAARAASSYIVAMKAFDPMAQEMGFEYFYWIYEYKNPDFVEGRGDPCCLYGFTKPVLASSGRVTRETTDAEKAKVPEGSSLVGGGHSHPPGGGEVFSSADGRAAVIAALSLDKNWHEYLLTPTNRLLVRDVWLSTDPKTGQHEVLQMTWRDWGFDPLKPPEIWTPPTEPSK